MAVGTAVLDFSTGRYDTSVAVADATVTGTTKVDAYIMVPDNDTGRFRDEYWVEALDVYAGNINPGVGFTMYAKVNFGCAFGLFTINYVTL